MIIISIITLVTCNELIIMKGVRRQRYTGCMTMRTMMMGRVFFCGQRGVKGSRRPHSHGSRSRRLKSAASVRQARQCVQTFGHCWKRLLQAKERRSMGHEAQSCTRHCSLTAGLNLLLSSCWLSDRDAVFSYSGAGSMSVFAGLSASRWHHRGIGTDPRCSWRSMSSRNASTILQTNYRRINGAVKSAAA